jgi:hypothetical protein
MTKASADITNRAREQARLRRMGHLSTPPARVQRSKKEPGSKELILGRWVEVKELSQ